jgi:hypothetical protein
LRLFGKTSAIALAALLVAVVVISPALGGPSLKKLIKKTVAKEVSKQLQNKQGPPGPVGSAGTSFDANASLPSGQTLTGVWLATGAGESGGAAAISFAPQLPVDLDGSAVHRIQGSSTTSVCPGPGAAVAGHLCVYERDSTLGSFSGIFNPATGAAGANRRGAQISYGDNAGIAVGTWAVTTP